MRTALNILIAATAIGCFDFPEVAAAAEDPAVLLQSIDQSLLRAGKFYQDKNDKEASTALDAAKASFDELSAAEVPESLRPEVDAIQKRLAAAERAIAKRKAPPPKQAAAAKKKAVEAPPSTESAKAKKSTRSKTPDKAPLAAPSFMADVAPILIVRCGKCHIEDARGGLSMANFAGLAKGARSGPIITPGASQASRMVEAIFTGDMPRGGGQVSPDELALISRWIDDGAKFDGNDTTAPLIQAPLGTAAGMARGNGPESVKFLRDLAPVLVKNCIGCHGGEKPAGELSLETMDSLLAGGTSGKAIDVAKPKDSLLIKRLRGADGERMPKGKPALSFETIIRFENWIKAGAKFDGPDAAASLKSIVEKSAAGRMSHEELSAKRLSQAEKIWQLTALSEKPEQQQTANFILLGNVSPGRLEDVARLAEAERAKIVKMLKLDGDAPLVKGSLILFVLKKPSDYGEFVRQVEKREVARDAVGHAQISDSDAYGVFVTSSESDDILPALLAEQIAGGFLYSLGDVPPWFAVGAARTIAARVEPKNPLVKSWEAETHELPVAESVDEFLSAQVFFPEAAAQSYAFVRTMAQKLPLFQALVAALGEEQDFEQAVTEIYRQDSRTLVERWLRRKPAGRG